MWHIIRIRTRRPRRTTFCPRGVTLIELLIALAISAIIIVALLALYGDGQKYFFNQNSWADTIEEIRSDMARISRDIRDASNVANGPVTAYDGQTYSTDEACLVLEVPSVDGTGQIMTGNVDHIIYSYNPVDHRLVKIVSPQAGVRQNQRTLLAANLVSPAADVPAFNLKYFNWDGLNKVTSGYADPDKGAFIVEIELTAQGRAIFRGGKTYVETFRTQAKLRNKIVPT